MIIIEEQNWQNKIRIDEVKGLIVKYHLIFSEKNTGDVNINYSCNAFILKMVCFFVGILEKIF